MYVVNYEDGWTVFPADSRFGVILMESEHGYLDLSEETENVGFNLWVKDLKEQIEFARKEDLGDFGKESCLVWDLFRPAPEEKLILLMASAANTKSDIYDGYTWAKVLISSESVSDTVASKDHLLQTKWGQSYPWNIKMYAINGQNCLTGCVAVAVSQVLYYFNHTSANLPSGLYHTLNISNATLQFGKYVLTLDRSNFVYNSSRWNNMPLYSQGGTTTGYQYVSELMLDVGARLNMHYGLSSSGVPVNSVNYFSIAPCNISCSWSTFSTNSHVDTVIYNLESLSSPVIMTATDNMYGTHTWVIDGYKTVQNYTSTVYAWYPVELLPEGMVAVDYMNVYDLLEIHPDLMIGTQEVSNTYPLTSKYFMMNWGYDGEGDDILYYASPSAVWSVYNYSFNTKKAMHYNIQPQELIIANN